MKENNEYELRQLYQPEEAGSLLCFEDAIKLAWRLIFQQTYYADQSKYGIDLLSNLKELHSKKWNSCWRYDALLGNAYYRSNKYTAGFEAIKRAYNNGGKDHAGLIIQLTECYHAPGSPLISREECVELLLQAMKDVHYIDGSKTLSGIYYSKNDQGNHEKWRNRTIELKQKKGSYSPSILPEFLLDFDTYDGCYTDVNQNIDDLFLSNNLAEIITSYKVDEAAILLDFKDAIKLSWRMLFQDYFNESQSEYGVKLLTSLRTRKSIDWNLDWRYDVILAEACENTYRDIERFEALKRAYQSGGENYPALLLRFANCHNSPEPLLLPLEESLRMAKRAMEKETFIEGAWILSSIYSAMHDEKKQVQWKEIAQKLEENGGKHVPHCYPKFLWDEEINTG